VTCFLTSTESITANCWNFIEVRATGIAVGTPLPSVKVILTVIGSTTSTCSALNRPAMPAWLRPLPTMRVSRSKE